jgi:hypothetical protein
MDALEDELDSDYERQRWEDFIDRYYCDDCTLERLMQDFKSSACCYYKVRANQNESWGGEP